MKTHRFFHQIPMALIGATITIFLVACTQSQPPTVKVTPESKPAAVAAPMKDVYVVFEGPWAIAPDPKDASFVVLVAPKTKAHRDLVITASNGSELAAGAYELSIPARAGAAAGTFDESILRVKIDPQAVQRVLDDKSSNRYAIRLPKPDAYLPASRHRSRVSAHYPPEEASEKEYATEVSMRYNVGNLSGFTLSGSPDVGSFNPLLLQVETPTIRFVIGPAAYPDPADKCHTHSRQAFHDVTALLGLPLYVDFPESPSHCHDTDPQKARPVKSGLDTTSNFGRLAALLQSRVGGVDEASTMPAVTENFILLTLRGSADAARKFAAAWYLFGRPSGVCNAPIVAADSM
jgi:hypothetical protein